MFSVKSLADINNKIIPHFDKYPLISQKLADYILFKQALEFVNRKEHLTPEGLQEIVNLKASMNRGLSETLTAVFPNTEPVPRPQVEFKGIQDPDWLAGFTSAEGCLAIKICKSASLGRDASLRGFAGGDAKTNTGFNVCLVFLITQHSRDEVLMRSLVEYLNCGNCIKHTTRDSIEFIVTRFSDIETKVISFFYRHPIVGVKSLDFNDFCKVANIMKDGGHLTKEGLEQIREIKEGMNSGRK